MIPIVTSSGGFFKKKRCNSLGKTERLVCHFVTDKVPRPAELFFFEMRSVSAFMWYNECPSSCGVRKARGHSAQASADFTRAGGKSQSAAYYGRGWRRSHNYASYLSASLRRAVSKWAVRHISVSGPRAPPAPRLKKGDSLGFCRNAAVQNPALCLTGTDCCFILWQRINTVSMLLPG